MNIDRFGRSVALSGDAAVVGVLDDDDVVSASGSAYMFELGFIFNATNVPVLPIWGYFVLLGLVASVARFVKRKKVRGI